MLRPFIISLLFALPASAPANAQVTDMITMLGKLKVTEVATGFDEPWGIGHLPEGGIIVTERGGKIIHLRPDGSRISVKGGPEIEVIGQGGLLDVMVPRDFAQSRELFFSYAASENGNIGTALGKGQLNADGTAFETFQKIWQMVPHDQTDRHFGSRVVEAADGTIFITTGDRGDRPAAQELSQHNGKVIRLNRSGSIPEDNPFVGTQGVEPDIYSYGHRNPQGAALDADGTLWVAEHGARGGDEVNMVKPGANYGWPVISYGTHYSGERIGEGTKKPGMEQPLHYWDPSIAPSGLMIYSGKMFPQWEGDLFVGSLRDDYISRLEAPNIFEREKLQNAQTGRVRDVVEGPDGAIWFLSVYNGGLYKITP